MKKLIVFNIICLGLAGMSFTDPFDTKEFMGIYGEWNTQFNDGTNFNINFFTDGTYTSEISSDEGLPNEKYRDVFTLKSTSNGIYYMKVDTLLISSNSQCEGILGKYKMNYKANETVRLSVIKDGCRNRISTFDDLELWRK